MQKGWSYEQYEGAPGDMSCMAAAIAQHLATEKLEAALTTRNHKAQRQPRVQDPTEESTLQLLQGVSGATGIVQLVVQRLAKYHQHSNRHLKKSKMGREVGV